MAAISRPPPPGHQPQAIGLVGRAIGAIGVGGGDSAGGRGGQAAGQAEQGEDLGGEGRGGGTRREYRSFILMSLTARTVFMTGRWSCSAVTVDTIPGRALYPLVG